MLRFREHSGEGRTREGDDTCTARVVAYTKLGQRLSGVVRDRYRRLFTTLGCFYALEAGGLMRLTGSWKGCILHAKNVVQRELPWVVRGLLHGRHRQREWEREIKGGGLFSRTHAVVFAKETAGSNNPHDSTSKVVQHTVDTLVLPLWYQFHPAIFGKPSTNNDRLTQQATTAILCCCQCQ